MEDTIAKLFQLTYLRMYDEGMVDIKPRPEHHNFDPIPQSMLEARN